MQLVKHVFFGIIVATFGLLGVLDVLVGVTSASWLVIEDCLTEGQAVEEALYGTVGVADRRGRLNSESKS